MTAAVTATFDATLAVVTLAVTGIGPGAQAVTVTRTSTRPNRAGTAGVTWESTQVRSWSAAGLIGTTATVKDYEYDPSDGTTYWLTTYRVVTSLGVDLTCTVRPVQTVSWLKAIQDPALNQAVAISSLTAVTRTSRVGIFPIVGARLPVAVTDRHQARVYSATFDTSIPADTADLETLLCSGNILLLQSPAALRMPGPLWCVAGDLSDDRPAAPDDTHLTTVPLTEVAPPLADSVVSWTYASIKASYASYASIKASWPSYEALKIGPAP